MKVSANSYIVKFDLRSFITV